MSVGRAQLSGPSDPPLVLTDEDTPVVITLALAVSSVPSCFNNGEPLVYSIISGPEHGLLSPILASNPPSVIYTPNPDFFGEDSFTWNIGPNPDCTINQTQSIKVSAINDPPIPQNLSLQIAANVPRAIVLTATDMEGDPLFELNEAFLMRLSSASGAVLFLNAVGLCTILNDDPILGTTEITVGNRTETIAGAVAVRTPYATM